MRVLLVDGDEEQAARTEVGLRASIHWSLTVQHVGSMGHAIRALTTAAFDLVVLELSLRDVSGIATLAAVRGAAPNTPIVVYAGALDDGLALRALRAGAQECLSKAETDPTRLGRALLFAMERHRRLRSLEAERVEAAHRATHDALTGLANRELFLDHLEQALAFGSRYGRKTGILFVDLDGFKRINDDHGHARGDALLRVVASRLIECVRRSDAVGRLGGDEFVVLLPDVTSRRDVGHVRETVLSCLREPVDVGNGQLLLLDASVGGAMSPLDGHTAQALLDAADTEMYREKHRRRRDREGTPLPGSIAAVGRSDGTSEPVDEKVGAQAITHRREARLREAVQADEFEVHFQPIVDVLTARFHGAEALLRWRDPDRGLLLPESFLALAEDTGLIVPLGEMVLRDACRSVVAWRELPGASSCRVAVNVSAVQLRERGFVRRVASILAEANCPADALTLELTENSMLVDGEIAIEALRELNALGTRLVVDDFGVGYASLTFVREAPIDGIKLDRRFVSGILRDSRDEAIIASIIRLAQGLHLDITAEGVESPEQAARLTQLHCFKQQGQHFSHAVPAGDITTYLRQPADWSLDWSIGFSVPTDTSEGDGRGRSNAPKRLFG
jgi:diguanylate cyclase